MTQQSEYSTNEDTSRLRRARATPKKTARTTKSAQLVKMLATKRGVDVATVGAKFGWQPHTTRAALSGLRKAGHTVVRDTPAHGKPARYRIVVVSDAVTTEDVQNAG